ncbi:MAG TPA: hypothetical protein VF058_07385 [Actinomycetota bacterium]
MRKRTKRLGLAIALAGALSIIPASGAMAHVHGITPLRCVGVADDGANRTNTTPAAAANGGPISGLLPSAELGSPGNSHLGFGDGGFDTPACPAP